jgi:hypothetical protein
VFFVVFLYIYIKDFVVVDIINFINDYIVIIGWSGLNRSREQDLA